MVVIYHRKKGTQMFKIHRNDDDTYAPAVPGGTYSFPHNVSKSVKTGSLNPVSVPQFIPDRIKYNGLNPTDIDFSKIIGKGIKGGRPKNIKISL